VRLGGKEYYIGHLISGGAGGGGCPRDNGIIPGTLS